MAAKGGRWTGSAGATPVGPTKNDGFAANGKPPYSCGMNSGTARPMPNAPYGGKYTGPGPPRGGTMDPAASAATAAALAAPNGLVADPFNAMRNL